MATLADVITGALAVVHGLTPSTSPQFGFIVHNEDDATPIEDIAVTHTRRFTLESVGPIGEDRFISQSGLGRPACGLELRVGYARGDYRTLREMDSVIAEDAVQLFNALAPVSAWSTWASNVWIETDMQRDDVTGDGGDTVAKILTLRMRAEWEA